MRKKLILLLFFLSTFTFTLSGCNNSKREIIGLIGAMDAELDTLKSSSSITKKTTIASMEFCEGTLEGKNVVIVKCGMGKVNAGICAQALINQFGCTKIINTGVAGSLDSKIGIGDLVISTDAVQHDFDVSYLEFKKGEIPYTGLVAFEADKDMRKKAVDAIKSEVPEISYFEGRVCSGDQFISTNEQKDNIIKNFGGLCCEMEDAAIAQVCYLNSTPFVIIRAISDNPNETMLEDYKTFETKAAKRCARVVQYIGTKVNFQFTL